MKIAITGATGFIGKGLTGLLTDRSHEVIVLSRDVLKARSAFGNRVRAIRWAPDNEPELVAGLEGIDAFINLAGENIGSSMWTGKKRSRIIRSRLSSGKLATDVVLSLRREPAVLIQASAVGFYGSRADEQLDETSAAGEGFLAELAQRWEDSTKEVEALSVRRVIIRTGVVFASQGGALPKLALPYRLLFGITMGSGEQWVPWIHYSDALEAIHFLATNEASSGIYNLVSPGAARMQEVCSAIGRALRRPTIMRLPAGLLKLLMGQMAEETILPSQRVSPNRLLSEGFQFRYPDLATCIGEVFSGRGRDD